MRKCNILVPIGCRSDEGISAPVIKRLKEAEWCEVYEINLENAGCFYSSMQECLDIEDDEVFDNIDLALITGDRVEMYCFASFCFHNQIKIAHMGAGIVADTQRVTFDE